MGERHVSRLDRLRVTAPTASPALIDCRRALLEQPVDGDPLWQIADRGQVGGTRDLPMQHIVRLSSRRSRPLEVLPCPSRTRCSCSPAQQSWHTRAVAGRDPGSLAIRRVCAAYAMNQGRSRSCRRCVHRHVNTRAQGRRRQKVPISIGPFMMASRGRASRRLFGPDTMVCPTPGHSR